jgi:hypothetical protein
MVWKVSGDYNTPQKLDRGIRCMIACHTNKEVVWHETFEGAMMEPLKPRLPWRL